VLKIVENLWAVGAAPRTPLGGAHRSPDALAGGEGLFQPRYKSRQKAEIETENK